MAPPITRPSRAAMMGFIVIFLLIVGIGSLQMQTAPQFRRGRTVRKQSGRHPFRLPMIIFF